MPRSLQSKGILKLVRIMSKLSQRWNKPKLEIASPFVNNRLALLRARLSRAVQKCKAQKASNKL